MTSQGTVLSLKDFTGPIKISASIFANNRPQHDCKYETGNDRYGFIEASVFSNAGSFYKHLLYIENTNHEIDLFGNSFSANAGSKGLIHMKSFSTRTKPVTIHDNTFSENLSFKETLAIFISATLTATLSDMVVEDLTNLYTGGYLIS